jgi:hypothetical protein
VFFAAANYLATTFVRLQVPAIERLSATALDLSWPRLESRLGGDRDNIVFVVGSADDLAVGFSDFCHVLSP